MPFTDGKKRSTAKYCRNLDVALGSVVSPGGSQGIDLSCDLASPFAAPRTIPSIWLTHALGDTELCNTNMNMCTGSVTTGSWDPLHVRTIIMTALYEGSVNWQIRVGSDIDNIVLFFLRQNLDKQNVLTSVGWPV